MDGFSGLLKRQLNNILTALLLVAAVFLFVRWRMRVAETEKQTIAGYLGNARESLEVLESGSFAEQPVQEGDKNYDPNNPGKVYTMSPSQAVKAAQLREVDIEKNVSDVLNSSSVDELTKLQALQIRGDLYWTLANFPLSAESAAKPDERMAETPDVLLGKASAAYDEIAAADHTKYAEQVDGAKLSLAAIAVDKGDWAGAQKIYQEVADDTSGPSFLRDQAKAQIAALPGLKNPSTLVLTTTAPSEETAVLATTNPAPAVAPIYGPPAPTGPMLPPVPGTMPTSLPVVPTPTSMPSPTPVVPATMPGK
jgi:hypothetical protein